MKKILLTGVALAALGCGSALAADLPARMPVKAPAPVMAYGYNWSGFYIGAHGGGGWSDRCFSVVGGAADGCHNADGWLGGGQVGWNMQTGQFVFGVEFSGSWADIGGSHASPLTPGDTYHSSVDSILLLTGRVGMTFDRMLLYVTGGGAWVRNEVQYTTGGVTTESLKNNRTGWTIGAGIEFGLTQNWSLAAQYNFIDLGDKTLTFVGPTAFSATADQEIHLATVRLNYRFGGGPVVARY
jgi:outer membrane immunogenic protein